jgi:hypothetical protein
MEHAEPAVGSTRLRGAKAVTTLLAGVVAALLLVGSASADPITIDPTSDGSLYVCDGCNVVADGDYVLVDGYIQGAIKFSSAPITGPVGSALLSLNPYGLPLWGPSIDVYGYGTTEGQLVDADANAGTYLGTWNLPADLGFGQDAYFDVTSFLMTVSAPFIAFNLRSTGTDVFSSLEFNYGHPSQLIVELAAFAVPEPSGWASFLIAAALLIWLRRAPAHRGPHAGG